MVSPDLINDADSQIIRTFALANSLDPSTLIMISAHAIAMHLRDHGTLTLPLQIGAASHHCHTCPFGLKSTAASAPGTVTNIVNFKA